VKGPRGESVPGDGGGTDAEPPIRRTVTVVNSRGLHARAAAKFVKLAGTFAADIEVARNDIIVSGRSIMGIMMLAAGPGAEIDIIARGPDARAAIDALENLIERKFDED